VEPRLGPLSDDRPIISDSLEVSCGSERERLPDGRNGSFISSVEVPAARVPGRDPGEQRGGTTRRDIARRTRLRDTRYQALHGQTDLEIQTEYMSRRGVMSKAVSPLIEDIEVGNCISTTRVMIAPRCGCASRMNMTSRRLSESSPTTTGCGNRLSPRRAVRGLDVQARLIADTDI
jgi:hypothetical protein